MKSMPLLTRMIQRKNIVGDKSFATYIFIISVVCFYRPLTEYRHPGQEFESPDGCSTCRFDDDCNFSCVLNGQCGKPGQCDFYVN